jgi:RNA polymerase sigma factor (sigma-70 family)
VNRFVPGQDVSDEALAARAAAGDDSAFETLVGRYQARVYRLACRLTSDTDAPDVLQDTFLQVYRRLSSFRGESQFATWLYRVATNTALMHRRASQRRPSESLERYLPRFDADGAHVATPAELQVTAHLPRKPATRSSGCPICIAPRSCCVTWRGCRRPTSRARSASRPPPSVNASTALV